jgi:hypothetical protein
MDKERSFWDISTGFSEYEQANGLLILHRSVFSRFCKCGANITMGLLNDYEFANVETRWNRKHSGTGHGPVSRHDWLMTKLSSA